MLKAHFYTSDVSARNYVQEFVSIAKSVPVIRDITVDNTYLSWGRVLKCNVVKIVQYVCRIIILYVQIVKI